MILVMLSLSLAGLTCFVLLYLFFWLVPRLSGEGKSFASFLMQWLLIASVVIPAIATAIFGPLWLYEVALIRATNVDHRLWLIASGSILLVLCFVAAVRSSAGKRYSSWRTSIA